MTPTRTARASPAPAARLSPCRPPDTPTAFYEKGRRLDEGVGCEGLLFMSLPLPDPSHYVKAWRLAERGRCWCTPYPTLTTLGGGQAAHRRLWSTCCAARCAVMLRTRAVQHVQHVSLSLGQLTLPCSAGYDRIWLHTTSRHPVSTSLSSLCATADFLF